MTALAAVFVALGVPAPSADVRRMLAAMPARGTAFAAGWEREGGALGAARDAWQATRGLGGGTLVAERDGVVVAADAALYYRAELRGTVVAHGVEVAGDDPAELIAAAYLAFGDDFVARLEGDFAFVLWDTRRRRVICARDHGGRRPLHVADLGGTLVVASTVSGVLAHPACPRALDVGVLGETAAGFLGATSGSCYQAVRRVEAGQTLTRLESGVITRTHHWEPPTFEQGDGLGVGEAAEVLRALLERAVAERLAPSGATAVFMSGGWDSPPIFAAGQSAQAQGVAPGTTLVPVSMSYPVGDPGREDEMITRIAAHWGTTPHWRRVDEVPLFGLDVAACAAMRDEPLVHVYDLWNRSLMRGGQEVGAHVVLDGIGGDALFQVSPVYLADLLASGRLGALARAWRQDAAVRAGGRRAFWQWAVRPAVPPALYPVVGLLRNTRPLGSYLSRPVPPWLRPSFVREHGLEARGRVEMARRPGETRSALESRWHFTAPWAPSLLGALAGVALEYELESRSPMYDRRVIAFAATRPRAERRGGGETKRLVRAAMRGLLPDDVLAPRAARTGLTSGYFARRVREELPAIIDTELRSVALADLGIVDADALRAAAAGLVRNPGGATGAALWFTLQTEWWVRARLGATTGAVGDTGEPAPAAPPTPPGVAPLMRSSTTPA